ncbi:hypothetical protein AVT69_gp052 [Pseudomonas phage PhiPA3]|uniref:Uncharacterized protein 051 n=1 Tax=Pseudomonas phage PhiPA3 TaxID=998086 RepID=F8SJT3_BPPA3|nr:hypothetical protein AVT69_gp052 [Pseudomonas phage PhiPA3]AEH03478.1 hypothetical protein [Pseudomonas phage PhiPA3]
MFALLCQQFVIDWKIDDAAWAKKVEDYAKGVYRVFGMTSSIHKGKIHEGGITLGPKSEEVAMASLERFETKGLGKTWRDLQPVKYLYHTRTDVNLPIMNNTTQGRAYGVISVNIPMLLVQYRYWLRWQIQNGVDQKENAYRFVGSIVLPNMIESYLDIAFFNRLDRASQHIDNPKFPVSHPFYLTDMSPRLDTLAEYINKEAILKGIELEGLAAITPMIVKNDLFDVIKLPREPVTYQNEWAITMARLPYIRYLIRMMQQNHGYDRSQLNEVMIDLIDSSNDQVYRNMGSSEFVKQFNKQIAETIADLKK